MALPGGELDGGLRTRIQSLFTTIWPRSRLARACAFGVFLSADPAVHAAEAGLQGELLAVLEQAVGGRRLSVEEVAREVKRLEIRTSGDSTRILRELRDGR